MHESPNPEQPEFIRKQYEFAAHIRDPQQNRRPLEVEDRRMAIYRDLFYNNVEGFLASGFPVLRQLFSDDQWHAMVRDFFVHHRCQTPLFAEINQEFLHYLQDERGKVAGDPPFLQELAHYEWVEMALDISDADRVVPAANPRGDLMTQVPVFSALAWNLSYHFPVHRIGPEFQPREPGPEPTHLVVYRGRDEQVGFLEINAVTQRLIQLLKENPVWRGLDAIQQIAHELDHPVPDQLNEAGRELLEQLRQRQIIVGTKAT